MLARHISRRAATQRWPPRARPDDIPGAPPGAAQPAAAPKDRIAASAVPPMAKKLSFGMLRRLATNKMTKPMFPYHLGSNHPITRTESPSKLFEFGHSNTGAKKLPTYKQADTSDRPMDSLERMKDG